MPICLADNGRSRRWRNTRLFASSAVAAAGLAVTWADIDRLGIYVTKGPPGGQNQIAWTSVKELARDNWPYGGVAYERFLERVWNAPVVTEGGV